MIEIETWVVAFDMDSGIHTSVHFSAEEARDAALNTIETYWDYQKLGDMPEDPRAAIQALHAAEITSDDFAINPETVKVPTAVAEAIAERLIEASPAARI